MTLQKRSVAHAIAAKYTAIFDDMGAGKTAQSLAISVLGGHQHTLIVCPSSLKDNWVSEIQKFTSTPLSQIYVGKGSEMTRLPATIATNFKFFIFNYETAVVSYKTPEIIPAPLRICTHIVFDEIHNMKNALSKKYLCWMHFLAKQIPNQLTLLTGTPFDRYCGENYSYLQLMDLNPSAPGDYPFTRLYPGVTHFDEQFARPRGSGDTFYSYMKEELPTLVNLFGSRFIRRNITDVTELPSLTHQDIRLPDHVFKECNMEELESKFKWALRMMAAQSSGSSKSISDDEMASMGAIQKIRVEISHAKVQHTGTMAEKYVSAVGPAVVFFEFVQPLLAFKERMEKKGYKVSIVHGSMSDDDQRINIDAFKAGEAHFFVCTFGTMAEGVNLQNSCAVLFNDIPWRPLLLSQAERRIWRIGQTRPCFKVAMLCRVDEIILTNIFNKTEYIQDLYGILEYVKNKERFL